MGWSCRSWQAKCWLPALGDKGTAPDTHRRPCVSASLCPCIPVLPEFPAPGPIGLRQPRRWSSRQGLSGTALFATEFTAAESMPCLMNALCRLSCPWQIFSPPMQCSWTHQRVWQSRFLYFLFSVSSKWLLCVGTKASLTQQVLWLLWAVVLCHPEELWQLLMRGYRD